MYDVTVIGAGVVGGLVARELSRYKLKICILEAENDVAMGATKANSAIVHAGFDAKEGSLKALLNVRGCEMMEELCNELGVRYSNNGSMVVAFNDEERETLQMLLQRGIANNVPDLRIVEKEELHKMEPKLSEDVICALLAPSAGIVCPYGLAISAVGNAMDNGAELRCNFKVNAIEKTENGYTVSSESGSVTTKYVINCAGMNSDIVAQMVGDNSFNIHARRGEYILLDRESDKLVNHTIFRTPSKMGKGILITPTVHENLLLGPTSFDISDKEDKDTTAAGFAAIIKSTNESTKFIPFHTTITSFCGLRSVGSTGDFIINSPVKGFINAAGIESPGLTSSPAIAEYIAEMLREDGLEMIPDPAFNPTRKSYDAFRNASEEEKNRIIKENPAYGKIVCRCEGVTEGEIIEAIHRNPQPRDLDGVKRRTRAQMGRCQGGFCGPYVVELLSKELGIPYESVTKFGRKSVINFEKTKGGQSE
ncbi:MAG: NAD(P)/FAD-dependent oxidoreductase [Clostridia bacterium]|nr:NAD(P)/FAD-dependent oxidoreductase [Clostridia bacterium]